MVGDNESGIRRNYRGNGDQRHEELVARDYSAPLSTVKLLNAEGLENRCKLYLKSDGEVRERRECGELGYQDGLGEFEYDSASLFCVKIPNPEGLVQSVDCSR
jgi:hypothetical protein